MFTNNLNRKQRMGLLTNHRACQVWIKTQTNFTFDWWLLTSQWIIILNSIDKWVKIEPQILLIAQPEFNYKHT